MKTGRPKQTEKRTKRVNIRFTEAEYEQLKLVQEKSNAHFATYLRKAALGQKIVCHTDALTLSQVRKIGVNINQIAKALHDRRRGLIEEEMLQELRRTTDALRDIYENLKGSMS